MKNGISVIVCCYNSKSRLPETLKYIANQKVSKTTMWEVIVVNNVSTDNTIEIALQEWKKYDMHLVPFRIINEIRPGLTHARETGFFEAKYEFVLFCDDDNWLCSTYIETSYNLMKSDNSIGVLGGCGVYQPEIPCNYEMEPYKNFYVNGPQTWVKTEHWVYGAGAIYRKNIYLELKRRGWTQITADRTGKKLLSGGDVEICYMYHLMGYKIYADARLKFQHFVPIIRQNKAYIQNLSFWLSYSFVYLRSYVLIITNEKKKFNDIYDEWLINSIKMGILTIYRCLVGTLKNGGKLSLQYKIQLNTLFGIIYSIIKNRKDIHQHHNNIRNLLNEHRKEVISQSNTIIQL